MDIAERYRNTDGELVEVFGFLPADIVEDAALETADDICIAAYDGTASTRYPTLRQVQNRLYTDVDAVPREDVGAVKRWQDRDFLHFSDVDRLPLLVADGRKRYRLAEYGICNIDEDDLSYLAMTRDGWELHTTPSMDLEPVDSVMRTRLLDQLLEP